MSRKAKAKSNEPSLRDKLNAKFMAAIESDFETNGTEVIAALRRESPAKYSEIVTRLIAAHEPRPEGFEQAKTMQDLGRRLLLSVNTPDELINDQMISDAIILNERFVLGLEELRDKAQSNGNAYDADPAEDS
jgi:hypothetical protein